MRGLDPIYISFCVLLRVCGCSLIQGWLQGNRLGLCLLVRHRRENDVYAQEEIVFSRQARQWTLAGLLEFLLLTRGFLCCVYQTEAGPVLLMNGHMNVGVVNLSRIHQAVEITHRASASQLPVLLCMDSNSDAEQPEMQWMCGEGGWQDAWRTANPAGPSLDGATWSSRNPLTVNGLLTEPDQRCDFVMALGGAGKLRLLQADLALNSAPFTSDHFAVLARYELKSAS